MCTTILLRSKVIKHPLITQIRARFGHWIERFFLYTNKIFMPIKTSDYYTWFDLCRNQCIHGIWRMLFTWIWFLRYWYGATYIFIIICNRLVCCTIFISFRFLNQPLVARESKTKHTLWQNKTKHTLWQSKTKHTQTTLCFG